MNRFRFCPGVLAVFCILFSGCSGVAEEPMIDVIDKAFANAESQALVLAGKYAGQEGVLPRTFEHGKDVSSDSRWWTSGFFPGTLWYIYENTGNPEILDYARMYTSRVEREKYTTDNHDVGFMLYCSFGNGLRITGDKSYEDVLLTGARSLSTRFNPATGVIRSWDHSTDKWKYPVIIDNMMNLELLFWAAERSGNDTLRQMAVSHADKTMKHHFRPDYSSYHVVSYDPATGEPHAKNTHQGFSDESSWSRGQSWGLYGYTCVYRFTRDVKYLDQARHIAKYLMNHRNMPEDGIPYWDYDAPDIPDTWRDASAAAVMASALIELSDYVDGRESEEYLEFAEKQLRSLASPEYTAAAGSNGGFILMHSTGALPFDSEIDTPLTYADYYYLEALTRMKKKIRSEAESQVSERIAEVVVRPEPDSATVLHNPLNGWVMYLARNWDETFWEKFGYDAIDVPGKESPVKITDYAGTAYLRTSWASMEPEKGEYFWKDPDSRLSKLLESCTDRGLKLAFRIVVDGRDQGLNTPQYVFDDGAGYYLENANYPQRKTPYPQDPVFRKHYERFIEAFAEEFNDPDVTAFVDGYGLGKWGEGHNVVYEPGNAVSDRTEELKAETMEWITGLYSRTFTRIPLVINYHRHIGHPVSEGREVNPNSEKLLQIAIDNGYCLRADSFGMNNQDWGYNDWERSYVKKWSCKLPIIMEGGWIVGQHPWWNDPAGYRTPKDVRMGEFVTSREEKVNMMDLRAGKETMSWFRDAFDLVGKFVSEGGYRLYPDQVTVPARVRRQTEVTVRHRWRNMGWGYCPNNIRQWNGKYKVAVALLDDNDVPVKVFVDKDSDPAQWIKDNPVSYDFSFRVGDVKRGRYVWAIAIVDTRKMSEVGIRLAVDKAMQTKDGWVKLSDVKVV